MFLPIRPQPIELKLSIASAFNAPSDEIILTQKAIASSIFLIPGLLRKVGTRGTGLAGPDPGPPKFRTPRGVLIGRKRQIHLFALDMELVEPLQERHAPLAPRPRAQAVADERRHRRVFALEKRADLPKRHVEAQTDIVVRVHGGIVALKQSGPGRAGAATDQS